MLKYRYGFVCALVALLFAPMLVSILSAGDPSTQPLIQFADLTYLGGFRLPDPAMNGDGFWIGGHPMAFNAARNSLFIGSRKGNVAEVAIPSIVNSNDILRLPFATPLQGFYEPTEGTINQVSSTGEASISGLLVSGSRLYGSAAIYYDANNTQRVSHYSHSTTLSATSAIGMRQVWDDQKSGFVSGYMAEVPAEWQSLLGGPAITGQCCLPVAWRTSWGPSAFAINPTDIDSMAKVPATPLLYYPQEHPNLGNWAASAPVYGGTTQIMGVAVLAGTRTVLYFGRNGTGTWCYGNGTSDKSLVGTLGSDGAEYCYDPTSTAKAQHAYPYNYQIWAYDLNDFAAVKAGQKNPWDVKPYGVWPFSLPFPEPQVEIGGVAYDPSRQIIYVSQMYADQDGYGYRPIIHALKVGGGAAGTPLPNVDATPLPPITSGPAPTSWSVSAATLTANKAAPQPAGTTITWTATSTGGTAPQQYKFLVHDGTQWTVASNWSTSNTFSWTPGLANNAYRVGVWVRSSSNTADRAEATTSADFPISVGSGTTTTTSPTPAPTTGTSSRLLSVALSANKAAPQSAGTTITFSAVPNGGAAPQQYKWLVHNGQAWSVVSEWSTANSYNWTPTSANNAYRVGVWVRSAGNVGDAPEVSSSMDFPVSAGSATATPPPMTTTTTTTSGGRLLSVALSASSAAPQPAGTTITFSAVPNGGTAPQQYKWLMHNGTAWSIVGDWTTASTFNWTPTTANNAYRIGVWVRSAGNIVDAGDVTASMDFPVTAGSTTTATATTTTTPPPTTTSPTPTTTTSGGRLLSVSLSGNKPAPQPAGTTITFSAVPNGGTAPQQYKWLMHNGTAWSVVGDWTTSNQFDWTPTTANNAYRIGVWVRSAGNTVDAGEVTASVDFPVTAGSTATTTITPPPTTAPTTSGAMLTLVTLTANKPAPQVQYTTITFTATPNGGTAPQQYKWLVHNGVQWSFLTDWSTSNTYNWTPAAWNSSYRIGVWVRSAGNTVDAAEVTSSMDFPITSSPQYAQTTPTTTPTTTSTTTTPAVVLTNTTAPVNNAALTAVSFGANKVAPQPLGSTITITAIPNGGGSGVQYKYLVHDGTQWSAITGWTTSNGFNWTPTSANAGYRIGVWVKKAGNTVDAPEVTASIDFPIK